MKVLKGIFIYTMLILGAVIAVSILLLGGMYLFKWSLFGYTFKNVNIQKDSFASINVENNGINATAPKVKFVIDSGAYAVRIQPDSANTLISYYTMSDFTGFVKSTDKVYTPSVTTTVGVNDENILQVNIKIATPEGWVKFDDEENRLVVVVPEFYDGKEIKYDVDINTTSGNIILKNSVDTKNNFDAPLRINSIVAKTESGNITLAGFEKELIRNKDDEIIGVKPSGYVELDNIQVTTKRGTLDFSSFDQIKINEKLILNSGKADYIFDKLLAVKGVEISGDNILVKANEITCSDGDFVFKSPSGGVQVGTLNCSGYRKVVTSQATETTEEKYHYDNAQESLNNVSIFTENANVNIVNLMGKARIENIYGHITIDLLSNQASIKNENGNITINKSGVLPLNDNTNSIMTATSSMVVYNTYGEINVKEYYQNGLFSNVKGATKLNSKFSRMQSSSEYFYTKVESKDGNVELVTAGNPYRIYATDKANVVITQNGVFKTNNDIEKNQMYFARTTNGSLSVNLPTVSSKAGNGYVLLVEGGLGSTPASTFANLKANEARYYMINDNVSLSGEPVGENMESALQNYPMVRLVSGKTYVYAQV